MQQSGVYKITLYERKNLALTYTDEDTISAISTGGNTIEITYCDKGKFEMEMVGSGNKTMLFDYIVSFQYSGVNETTDTAIDLIKDSIDKYSPLIYFHNGDTFFIDAPFILEGLEMTSSQTHAWNMILKNIVPTDSIFLSYEP